MDRLSAGKKRLLYTGRLYYDRGPISDVRPSTRSRVASEPTRLSFPPAENGDGAMEPEDRMELEENVEPEEQSGNPSRRQFLKGVGAVGAGLVAGSLGADSAVAKPRRRPKHGHHHH